MKNTFNSLLIFLFCIDSFYLVIEEVSSIQTILATTEENDDFITLLVPHFLYPMESVSLTASIFMTVGIAHERYIAIKSPIKHRQSMRSNSARRIRLIKYIMIVIFCSFAINLPKFFEREIIWVVPTVEHGHKITEYSENNPKPILKATSLRKNSDYATYYNNLARLLLLGIIPFGLLAYFNYRIYRGMKLPSFLSDQENIKEQRKMQESDLATVLIGIVVVFVLSHALRIFLNIYEMIKKLQNDQTCYPTWLDVTKVLNDLFLILNSSSNMIIYCCLNSTFRKYLKQNFKKITRKFMCKKEIINNRQSYENVGRRRDTSENTL